MSWRDRMWFDEEPIPEELLKGGESLMYVLQVKGESTGTNKHTHLYKAKEEAQQLANKYSKHVNIYRVGYSTPCGTINPEMPKPTNFPHGTRVRYKNCTTEYVVIITEAGAKVLQHCKTNRQYPFPINVSILARVPQGDIHIPSAPVPIYDFDLDKMITNPNGEENTMSYPIQAAPVQVPMTIHINLSKVFKDVDELMLVTHHLGGEYNQTHKDLLFIQDHKDVILKEAKRLEAELIKED